MKEEKQTVYALWVLRKDQEHISVIESVKYDEVFELYLKVKEKWELCIKEQKPFELLKPIVTAFDPGLIYEITIRPLIESSSTKYDNPYQQQMLKSGLSSVIKSSSDLLDGGYR